MLDLYTGPPLLVCASMDPSCAGDGVEPRGVADDERLHDFATFYSGEGRRLARYRLPVPVWMSRGIKPRDVLGPNAPAFVC